MQLSTSSERQAFVAILALALQARLNSNGNIGWKVSTTYRPTEQPAFLIQAEKELSVTLYPGDLFRSAATLSDEVMYTLVQSPILVMRWLNTMSQSIQADYEVENHKINIQVQPASDPWPGGVVFYTEEA